jgi:hypothetical protein
MIRLLLVIPIITCPLILSLTRPQIRAQLESSFAFPDPAAVKDRLRALIKEELFTQFPPPPLPPPSDTPLDGLFSDSEDEYDYCGDRSRKQLPALYEPEEDDDDDDDDDDEDEDEDEEEEDEEDSPPKPKRAKVKPLSSSSSEPAALEDPRLKLLKELAQAMGAAPGVYRGFGDMDEGEKVRALRQRLKDKGAKFDQVRAHMDIWPTQAQ